MILPQQYPSQEFSKFSELEEEISMQFIINDQPPILKLCTYSSTVYKLTLPYLYYINPVRSYLMQ